MIPPERISITGPTQESVEKKWTNPVDGCKWLCMAAFDLTTETFKGTCRTKGDRGISQVSLSEIPILLTSTLPQILSSTQLTKLGKLEKTKRKKPKISTKKKNGKKRRIKRKK